MPRRENEGVHNCLRPRRRIGLPRAGGDLSADADGARPMRYNAPAEGHAITMLSYLANPARFMRISGVALPWLGGARLLLLALCLGLSRALAPAEHYAAAP